MSFQKNVTSILDFKATQKLAFLVEQQQKNKKKSQQNSTFNIASTTNKTRPYNKNTTQYTVGAIKRQQRKNTAKQNKAAKRHANQNEKQKKTALN